MTAEIVIMNKEAVVLAADSAVTLQRAGLQKVSISADKIFQMSMNQPIGIMMYGNASFAGLPWETVIKSYRDNRARRKCNSYDSIEECGKDFIKYLESNDIDFDSAVEETYIEAFTLSTFQEIDDRIDRIIGEWIEEGHRLTKTILHNFMKLSIQEYYHHAKEDFDQIIPTALSRRVVNRHWDHIESIMKHIFEENAMSKIFNEKILTKEIKGKLKQSLVNTFSKFIRGDISSGIVIAGFGEKEFVPRIKTYEIEGIISGQLKYKEQPVSSITENSSAQIAAFAQRDIAVRFMEGVDTLYRAYEDEYIHALCIDYAKKVTNNLRGYSSKEKGRFKKQLIKYGDDLRKEFNKKMDEFVREEFVEPILDTVAALPKAELATVAEALVYITSVKRKVSLEEETVAGPIDVAVISKHDGFVWIKRKQYFEVGLNPQLLQNKGGNKND